MIATPDEFKALVKAAIVEVLDERERAKVSPDDVLTVEEAAVLLKTTARALTRRTYRGSVPHIEPHRPGTAYRFRRGDITGGK